MDALINAEGKFTGRRRTGWRMFRIYLLSGDLQ